MATIPPPLNTHAVAHQNPFQNATAILQQQQQAQYDLQQSSCQIIKTKSQSSLFNFNKIPNFDKLELKAKNYNPFDNNNAVLSEVRKGKRFF
jgi:hypothetical protein